MFKRIYPLIIFINLITALAWAAPDGVKQNLSCNSATELAEFDTLGGTNYEELEDGDICFVVVAATMSWRLYIYDSDSAQTEDGERYVTPDETSTGNAYSGDARWVCMSTMQAGADGDFFAELSNNTAIDPDASRYQIYFDNGEFKVNENGTEKTVANLTDAQTFAGAITFGSTVSGSAGYMTVTATGFDGNLETTDDTLQEIAQALDDLTISAGISDGDKGDITVASSGASWSIDAFAHTASPNWIFYDSDNAGTDEECARIEANATTTTDGAEDADLIFSVMQGGTVTPVLTFDESDDQWETTKGISCASLSITRGANATTSRWYEDLAGGNQYIDFFAPSAITTSYSVTWPNAAPGGSNYLLNMDADGTMGWTDPSTLGGASLSGGTDNRLVRWDGTTGVQTSAYTEDDAGRITPPSVSNPYAWLRSSSGTADYALGVKSSSEMVQLRYSASVDTNLMQTWTTGGVVTLNGGSVGENLIFTPTSNKYTVSTSTDVADLDFSAINLATTGTIIGRVPMVTKTEAGAISTTEAHGSYIMITAAGTYTLPAAATAGYGSVVCVRVRDVSEVVVIDPDGSEIINLGGAALTAGYAIKSSGAAGDQISLISTTDTNGSGADGWIVTGTYPSATSFITNGS